ncbi:MAG: PhnD/SsuA/transferrin family substrate-binding protein [Bacteroidota bacterium]
MRAGFSIMVLLFCLLSTLNSIAQDDIFRIGVIEYKSEEKVLETFGPIANYIGKKLGRQAQLEIVPAEALGFRLSQGELDMGVFKPFPYLKAKVDFPKLQVFATHKVNNLESYTGLILVNEESGIKLLRDLKDKEFLFVKPQSTSGYSYPKGIFREHDIDIDSAFFNYDFSYDHNTSLEALRKKEVDGIAISTENFGSKDDINLSGVHILEEFEVPYHAYVLSPRLDSALKNDVKDIMFTAEKDPSGKVVLNNSLHITGWVPKDDHYYNYLRRYLRIVRVKPAAKLVFEVQKSAREYFDSKGDMLNILEQNMRNALSNTHRFSKVGDIENISNYEEVKITLSKVDESTFHYASYFNDDFIEGFDLQESQLREYLHLAVVNDVLSRSEITTRLLSNGEKWFVTYGTNDGLRKGAYQYTLKKESGEEVPLKVKDITELNTTFKKNGDYHEDDKVTISYKLLDIESEGISVLRQLSMDGFWQKDFWDKLGLIGGIVVAIISAVVGWFFNTRKKRRFKSILNQANYLMKEFLEDKYKLDLKLTEIKEQISQYLESGQITENQFLILNSKLDEVEKAMGKPVDEQDTGQSMKDVKDIIKKNKIDEN